MDDTDDEFYAEDSGPPRRKFWIVRDAANGPIGSVRGWAFGYDEFRNEEWFPVWDTWERWFYRIIDYPQAYASKPLRWHRHGQSETVLLAELQPYYDGVPVKGGTEIDPVEVGLER